MRKFILLIIQLFLLLFIYITYSNGRNILLNLGLIKETIYIAGTGSMYPTFPKGEGETDIKRAQETVAWPLMQKYPGGLNLLGFNFLGYTLKRGDIIDFENSKTREISAKQYGKEAGFVKRIIALPGDTLEIRDGFVYLNKSIFKEPYTAAPRSTFGGQFLADCQSIVVPNGQLFVMGDNRKSSLDSRFELGLINYEDIIHVMPKHAQTPYEKSWRQTDTDELNANKPTLNIDEFITLLNQEREEKKVSALKYNELLTQSAKKRAEIMLATNDFSIEATRSGYTLEDSIQDVGYENILYAESLARGYFQASELLDNLLHFPETKNFILSYDYQDIGIAPVVGNVNNCPVQAVVIHLGGYQPPNYKKEDIESWQKLYENLKEVIPSWEKAKNAESVNQETLNSLLTSLYRRMSNIEKILYKLNNNLWLSKEEKALVEEDQKLASEEDELIRKLNQ